MKSNVSKCDKTWRAHFTKLKISSIVFHFVHKKSFTIHLSRSKLHFRAAAPRPLDHFAPGNLAARRFSTSAWHGCSIRQFPPDKGGRHRHRDGAPRPASPFLSCSTRSHPRRRGRHPRPLRAGSASRPRPRHGHLVLSHVFNHNIKKIISVLLLFATTTKRLDPRRVTDGSGSETGKILKTSNLIFWRGELGGH